MNLYKSQYLINNVSEQQINKYVISREYQKNSSFETTHQFQELRIKPGFYPNFSALDNSFIQSSGTIVF